MIHDSEFDLTWSDPPPGWAENVGPLLEIWGNPIFQRRYVKRHLKPFFGSRKSFLAGLAGSLLINLILLFGAGRETAPGFGFFITVIGPGITILGIMLGRWFISCMIATPLELKRELSFGMLGALLSAPISDSKVFFAEVMSGLMRGIGSAEEVFSFVAGLVASFVVVMSPQIWEMISGNLIVSFWWLFLVILVIVHFGLQVIHTTLAAGLYAIILPVAAVIPVTLLHVVALFFSTGFICLLGVSLVVQFEWFRELNPLIVLLVLMVLQIVFTAMFINFAGQLGVNAFAKARRPGFYEPDQTNAAGLLKREPESRMRFGQKV